MSDVKLISQEGSELTFEIKFSIKGSMLEAEESLLKTLNGAGVIATQKLLSKFDTDGTAICIGSMKMTSKGKQPKNYRSPYGDFVLDRHVYQTAEGGPSFCPLEKAARILTASTPKFAKMISSKYSKMTAEEVRSDLKSNHGRELSETYIQQISETVSTIALAKEETWEYQMPKLKEPVAIASIGLDGTTLFMRGDGWRIGMVGTISLFNKAGERLHTTYTAAIPEYGKETFITRMEQEIALFKKKYPKVESIGLGCRNFG